MKLLSLSVAIAGAALLPPLLFADAPPSLRPPFHEKAIWEPEGRLGNQVLVPGFFRPAERAGYLWIEAQRDDYGRYFPGYWEPVGPYRRKGGEMAWVPGRFANGRWTEGYWRVPTRNAYSWFNGYFDENGRWHDSWWIPDDPAAYFPDGPACSDDVRLSRAAHPRWGYKETVRP